MGRRGILRKHADSASKKLEEQQRERHALPDLHSRHFPRRAGSLKRASVALGRGANGRPITAPRRRRRFIQVYQYDIGFSFIDFSFRHFGGAWRAGKERFLTSSYAFGVFTLTKDSLRPRPGET